MLGIDQAGVLRLRRLNPGARVLRRLVLGDRDDREAVVPQLRAVSALGGLSADVATTVGTATIEVDVRDSVTGRRLAAAVDSRAGNKALFAGRSYTKWGDVQYATNLWTQRIAWQLVRHGVQRKPGAPDIGELPESPRQM